VLVALLVSVIGQGGAWAQVQTFAPPVESEVTYYHTDAIGSVRLLTRQDGSAAERYDYNPFGKALSVDVPAKNGDQPRGFGGKERDDATGFDYFGGRYLLSDASRFTTVDPVLDMDSALTDPQRWSRYAYVRNNPLRYVDPDGKCIWDACALEAIAIVSVTAMLATYLVSPQGREAQATVASNIGTMANMAMEGTRELATGTAPAAPVAEDGKAPGGPGANIGANNKKGTEAEDGLEADLRAAGKDVERAVRKETPFGPRIIDIEVKDEKGKPVGGIEVKSGNSRYRPDQRSKDQWLRWNGYYVDLVRVP
jgi:RHS repeat-associated protein